MDPQVSKILLKTSRYKTEIFKLETKRKSMADKKKTKQNSFGGIFYRCKITSLDT